MGENGLQPASLSPRTVAVIFPSPSAINYLYSQQITARVGDSRFPVSWVSQVREGSEGLLLDLPGVVVSFSVHAFLSCGVLVCV